MRGRRASAPRPSPISHAGYRVPASCYLVAVGVGAPSPCLAVDVEASGLQEVRACTVLYWHSCTCSSEFLAMTLDRD
jgi:hypothetical protein